MVRFLGHVKRPTLVDLFTRCHAYLLPGIEDFGIAPLEAAAAGKPCIAYRAGGALETVREGLSGVFFDEPDARSLADAIEQLDAMHVDPQAIRQHAERFDRQVFLDNWRQLLQQLGVDPRLYSGA